MIEVWKDIPNYEGMYQVSNLGNVKSLQRPILLKGKYPCTRKEKILYLCIDSQGYYRVGLLKENKRTHYKIHQLVAMAFLNHVPCGMNLVIDHINDIKTDNRLENLQIVTPRYNTRKTQGNYTSKYKGVNWHKRDKKWYVAITINGKKKHLGSYQCELKAHYKYQQALKEIQ
jgi:hypothetical protein